MTTSSSPSDAPPAATPVDLENALARERVRGALFGEPAAPVMVDRFTILARIGRGGMSTVYSAYDPRLDRRIALKLLRRGDDDATHGSQDRQARLLREARAMARLSHPNVAVVHDVGLVDPDGEAPQVWIAMEFIDGEPLGRWCARARPSVAEILAVYVQAGRGLAAAHAAGLVHRDFKPDNAMRDAVGRVRVLDFGLARALDERPAMAAIPTADDRVAALATASATGTGAIVGTPGYMAPELFEGRVADAASDQFGFCAALYEALWGERAYAGSTLAALVTAFDRGTPSPPRRRDVPAAVRTAVLRGLDRDPAARWPTMEALLARLAGARGRTTRMAGAAIAIASVAGAFAIAATREPPCAGADLAVADDWNDDTRAAVTAALSAVDRHYATDVAARVRERIDGYASELASAYRGSCTATRETRMQSEALLEREIACLDRRRLDLRALVEVLRDADVDVLDRAVQAANGLAPLAPCLDREALATAPLADVASTTEVDELIARAHASSMAGRYDDARTQAESALALAQGLADDRLRAEAEHSLGWALGQLGDDREAYRHLADAHYLADGTRQDMLAAESATRLISTIEISAGTREELELWRKNAQAAIDRVHDDGLSQAALDATMGFALQQRGELAEARAAYERALEVRLRTGGGTTALVTGLQTQLAGVLAMLGENANAMQLVDAATTAAAEQLGATHPHRGQMLINAAAVHIQCGDLEGGERIAREALAVLEPSLGHDHTHIANTLSNLGGALGRQGRTAESAEAFAEAVAIFERLDKRGQQWANITDNYAQAIAELGRLDEAIARSRLAQSWYVEKQGADGVPTGHHHVVLAALLARAGRRDDAETELRRALAIAKLTTDTELESRATTALAATPTAGP